MYISFVANMTFEYDFSSEAKNAYFYFMSGESHICNIHIFNSRRQLVYDP